MLRVVSQQSRTNIIGESSWAIKVSCYFDELAREIDAKVKVICVLLLIKAQTILDISWDQWQ